jgi:cytochrome c-type biogenesis protein
MFGPEMIGPTAFAAGAGIATFFAPCAFPLLPGYVGYYMNKSDKDPRMVAPAVAAAVGALASLSVVAGLVLAVGQRMKQALPALEPVIGIALVVFGIVMVLGREPEVQVPLPGRSASVTGFGVFGAVYAVAAAGCVVPLLFGVVSQAVSLGFPASLVVLTVYALGVAVPLVGVTLLAGIGVDSWRSLGRYTEQMKNAAATLMILAGVGQVYLSVFRLGVL